MAPSWSPPALEGFLVQLVQDSERESAEGEVVVAVVAVVQRVQAVVGVVAVLVGGTQLGGPLGPQGPLELAEGLEQQL